MTGGGRTGDWRGERAGVVNLHVLAGARTRVAEQGAGDGQGALGLTSTPAEIEGFVRQYFKLIKYISNISTNLVITTPSHYPSPRQKLSMHF